MMKSFFTIAAVIGAAAGMYYLYQHQLGAISFFLLSVFFFSLAYSQLKDTPEQKEDADKERIPPLTEKSKRIGR